MRGSEAAIASQPEILPAEFQAEKALEMMDAFITELYLPFRGAPGYGTERAILCEPAHVPHRENDAEHTWHIEATAEIFWDNRAELGLRFPADFDINKALSFARWHDIVEIKAPDVDGVTTDQERVNGKAGREHAAIRDIVAEHPFMKKAASRWLEYEQKDSYEAQYISDIDKIAATRLIFLDGGNKWHDWEGTMCTRERMCEIYRSKLRTDFGHALFDAMERSFDEYPERFPEREYRQDALPVETF